MHCSHSSDSPHSALQVENAGAQQQMQAQQPQQAPHHPAIQQQADQQHQPGTSMQQDGGIVRTASSEGQVVQDQAQQQSQPNANIGAAMPNVHNDQKTLKQEEKYEERNCKLDAGVKEEP